MNWAPQNQLSQSLTINSGLIQSIKLLQFAREELETYVIDQCQRNPLIEIGGGPEPINGYSPPSQKKVQADDSAFRSGVSGMSGRGQSSPAYAGDDQRRLEELVPSSLTLRDYLRSQRGSAFRDPVDLRIASHLIECLDEDGYMRGELDLMVDELGASVERIEKVLRKIQEMDPPGVGARSLAECLRLQLIERCSLTPELDLLLDNLPHLAAHKYPRLTAICGVSVEAIMAMAKQIKELDPRPGRRFECAPIVPIVPDVTVTFRDDGTVLTMLNSNALPRVLVNRQYYSEIKARCRDVSDMKFVTDCLKDANMLVRSLDQRAQTILKVATEVVARQKDFLLRGVEHLKPLILREVADAVGVHQSTVSRAISSKYIMTHCGLFELKYFFDNSISATGDQEGHASEAVRHRIRQMIAGEMADAIFSDDAIVKELRDERIQIARRTVAKYRESMDIPSSHQRRRMRLAEMSVTSRSEKVGA